MNAEKHLELDYLILEIRKCRSQKNAIQLAAKLVLLFTGPSYRISTLGDKFMNALDMPIDKKEEE